MPITVGVVITPGVLLPSASVTVRAGVGDGVGIGVCVGVAVGVGMGERIMSTSTDAGDIETISRPSGTNGVRSTW